MTVFRNFIRSWLDLLRFRKLPAAERRVVFYSEGRTYVGFLAPVMESLAERHGDRVCYLTSDANDPFLVSGDQRFRSFYIGRGAAMITAFQTLKATVLVMTAPDLNSFHIKRSVHPVHYAYLFHSMVSSHMIYREGAFDHFEAIDGLVADHQTSSSDNLLLLYLKLYLPSLLVQEDKMGMAHSIEVRMPLCDNTMIDLALQLPMNVKLAGGRLKAVPRKAISELVPASPLTMPNHRHAPRS
jgi:hypothetical protein